MTVKIFQSRRNIIITFFRLSAIIFLASPIIMSFILMNALAPEDREKRVRLIVMHEV